MDNTNPSMPEMGGPIPPTAVSVYPQSDAMDDFPVLKAFQQYVDAEHAKAQKRMVTLCVFFIVLMVAVIGVFVMMVMSMSSRNNTLSDQLFQYVLREHERTNAAAMQPRESDSTIRTLTDTLNNLQREMLAQQSRMAAEQMRMADEAMKKVAAANVKPVGEQERSEFDARRADHEKSVREETERLKKAREALQAEKERLAKERERLHDKEIDLQRRNLYPDAYRTAAPGPQQVEAPAVDDYSEIDAELAREEQEIARLAPTVAEPPAPAAPVAAPAPVAVPAPAPAPAVAEETPAYATRADGSRRYFDDAQEVDEDEAAMDSLLDTLKPAANTDAWSMPEE